MFFSLNQVFLFCFVLLKTASSSPQLYKIDASRRYYIETEQKYNWYQAMHECARINSRLVEIHSAKKNVIVMDILKEVLGKSYKNIWLGGNDELSSSTKYNRPFVWTATGKQMNFSYWTCDNPDNYQSREHCVHVSDDSPFYQWNDNDCNTKMGFICESNDFCL